MVRRNESLLFCSDVLTVGVFIASLQYRDRRLRKENSGFGEWSRPNDSSYTSSRRCVKFCTTEQVQIEEFSESDQIKVPLVRK